MYTSDPLIFCANLFSNDTNNPYFFQVVGGAPYSKPSKSDIAFQYIYSGNVVKLLAEWRRIDYVTPEMVDVMIRIFKRESKRINIADIKKHPWLL